MDSERVRPAPAPTGDPRVDEAIGRLASLEDVDLAERPAVLEGVHDRLREILGELGDQGGSGPAAPVRPGEPGRHGEQGELGGALQPGDQQPGPGQTRPGQPQPGQARPGAPGPGSWPRRPNA
jgi:hypothetical protein